MSVDSVLNIVQKYLGPENADRKLSPADGFRAVAEALDAPAGQEALGAADPSRVDAEERAVLASLHDDLFHDNRYETDPVSLAAFSALRGVALRGVESSLAFRQTLPPAQQGTFLHQVVSLGRGRESLGFVRDVEARSALHRAGDEGHAKASLYSPDRPLPFPGLMPLTLSNVQQRIAALMEQANAQVGGGVRGATQVELVPLRRGTDVYGYELHVRLALPEGAGFYDSVDVVSDLGALLLEVSAARVSAE